MSDQEFKTNNEIQSSVSQTNAPIDSSKFTMNQQSTINGQFNNVDRVNSAESNIQQADRKTNLSNKFQQNQSNQESHNQYSSQPESTSSDCSVEEFAVDLSKKAVNELAKRQVDVQKNQATEPNNKKSIDKTQNSMKDDQIQQMNFMCRQTQQVAQISVSSLNSSLHFDQSLASQVSTSDHQSNHPISTMNNVTDTELTSTLSTNQSIQSNQSNHSKITKNSETSSKSSQFSAQSSMISLFRSPQTPPVQESANKQTIVQINRCSTQIDTHLSSGTQISLFKSDLSHVHSDIILDNDVKNLTLDQTVQMKKDQIDTYKKTDEMKTDEMKTDEIKTDEMKTDEMKTDEMKTDEMKTDEMTNQTIVKADELTTDRMEIDEKTEKVLIDDSKTIKQRSVIVGEMSAQLVKLIQESKQMDNEMSTRVTLDLNDLNGLNINNDLKLYLRKLNKIANIIQTFFNISVIISSQIEDLRRRILLFEKMDYEVDKELYRLVTDCKQEKYLEKLKVVNEAIEQIDKFEKLTDLRDAETPKDANSCVINEANEDDAEYYF